MQKAGPSPVAQQLSASASTEWRVKVSRRQRQAAKQEAKQAGHENGSWKSQLSSAQGDPHMLRKALGREVSGRK